MDQYSQLANVVLSNMEIEQILEREDLVRHVKSMRLRWLGHVERMQEERMPKQQLHEYINIKGKPGKFKC